MSLNVCGLLSKLNCPEFLSLIHEYDLICIQESRLDDLDTVTISGYQIFIKNRAAVSRFRSGGIALIVKNKFSPYIRLIKSDSKLIIWFSISKLITDNNEDLICGVVYIPPAGSKYASPDPYLELQNEFNKFCANSKLGDYNSRTSSSDDFVLSDEFICDIFGDDDFF